MMKPGGVMVASSPGRDKLPTPGLTRLISRKAAAAGGSRSHGRSDRSSPMFVSWSKSVSGSATRKQQAAAAEEGEPCSPKVTCIGQVRMRNKRAPKKRSQMPAVMPCRCLHKSLICSLFHVRKKPKDLSGGGNRRSAWLRWAFLGVRSEGSDGVYQQQKPSDENKPPSPPQLELVLRSKSSDPEDDHDGKEEEHEEEENESENEKKKQVFVPYASTTPPKNALLLMRCRSAPHNRASTLAREVSPLPLSRSTEPATVQQQQQLRRGEELEKEDGEEKVEERRRSSNSSTRVEEELDTVVAVAAEKEEVEEEEEEEEEGMRSESKWPLVLTRSKSEPAGRAAAKLAVPEASYCFGVIKSNSSGAGGSTRQRRFGSYATSEDLRAPPPLVSSH